MTGKLPAGPTPLSRRAALLIERYGRLFDWYEAEPTEALGWQWPERPVLNVEGESRDASPSDAGGNSEAALEHLLYDNPEEFAWVNRHLPDHERLRTWPDGHLLRRQLPMGLFDGYVSKATEWCPRGRSAVDLWGVSERDRTVHLFELKIPGNRPLGILPESLYYATLAAAVRDRRVTVDAPGGPGTTALATAERIVTWLVAPRLHPLLLCESGPLGGKTLLQELNEALAPECVELRFLPYRLVPEARGGRRFAWDTRRAWPGAAA